MFYNSRSLARIKCAAFFSSTVLTLCVVPSADALFFYHLNHMTAGEHSVVVSKVLYFYPGFGK